MAVKEFTAEQKNAINAETGNLLVYAAAGSGKTAVLTERVIHLLTKENPVSADKLIIVTFTVAAASELKKRILKRLNELVRENPENDLYKTQQMLLPKAHISTIHSLCSSLVKNNFHILGLSGDMKLADETQVDVIKKEVLDTLLEEYYAKEDNAQFLSLVEMLSKKNDKAFQETILDLYSFLLSFPFPFDYLENVQNEYLNSKSIEDNMWSELVLDYALSGIDYAIDIIKSGVALIKSDDDLLEKTLPTFVSDLDGFEKLREVLIKDDVTFEGIANQINELHINKVNLYFPSKYPNKELSDIIKQKRSIAYKYVDEMYSTYFINTNEEFNTDIKILREKITLLFEIEKEFILRVKAEKQEQNIMDYSDLEDLTLKLLCKKTENGYEKTDICKELSDNIEEIMVDECQDINETQNTIFNLLSKNKTNLFTVGDIKQSIYRFRKAMPKIMIDRRNRLKLYDEKNYITSKEGTILLDKNFRSRKEICYIINYIFSGIMSEKAGEIDYNEEEYLSFGANYYEEPTDEKSILPEICIVDCKKEDLSAMSKLDYEASFVAKKIKTMLDNKFMVQDKNGMRACKPSDFAILLRSTKDRQDVFKTALMRENIKVVSQAESDFFTSVEVMLAINLLKVINNPLLDIEMLSVMMSPVFGFTTDDVSEIRLTDKKLTLYANLRLAAESSEKCHDFIKILDVLREKASVLPCGEIVDEIYNETDFIETISVMGDVEKRVTNLRLLSEYAKQYETFGSDGLSGFLRYVDKLKENKKDLKSAENTSALTDDSVKIMTIHGSKGLEFPVCIVANCGKEFNKMDIRKRYQFNDEMGVSFRIIDKEKHIEYSPLPLEAIKLKSELQNLAEEMRVFYVALTRAKEKLILTASVEDLSKQIVSVYSKLTACKKVNPYCVINSKSYFEWILEALFYHPAFSDLRKENGCLNLQIADSDFDIKTEIVPANKLQPEITVTDEKIFSEPVDNELLKKIQASVDYKYKYELLTKIPAKLAVTQIVKEQNLVNDSLANPMLNVISEDKLTPAQKGTILHNFMQFADFKNAEVNLDNEIKRLVENEYFTDYEAKTLKTEEIQAFLKSNIYSRIKAGKDVQREYKFFYFVKSNEIEALNSDIDEQVLVQGIADCIIVEDDGMVLVDYKTDREKDEGILKRRYFTQLTIYKKALEQAFKLPVKECILYSLYLKKEILLDKI